MSQKPLCCPTDVPAITTDYAGNGKFMNINGVKTYVTGSGPMTILVVYDIFGFHGNTLHFTDSLAVRMNAKCVMPDVFQGNYWDQSDYPPKNRDAFNHWLSTEGSDERFLDQLNRITPFILDGAETLGLVGFCFGAAKVFLAAHDPKWQSVAVYHPSFLHEKLIAGVQCPALVINTKTDAEHLPLRDILASHPEHGSKLQWNHWWDIHHGFCSARGDHSDAYQKQRITDAMDLTVEFMNTHKYANAKHFLPAAVAVEKSRTSVKKCCTAHRRVETPATCSPTQESVSSSLSL